MTKSELINILTSKHSHLSLKDVDSSVRIILEQMVNSLANGERIEVRGFGSFSLHYRKARQVGIRRQVKLLLYLLNMPHILNQVKSFVKE